MRSRRSLVDWPLRFKVAFITGVIACLRQQSGESKMSVKWGDHFRLSRCITQMKESCWRGLDVAIGKRIDESVQRSRRRPRWFLLIAAPWLLGAAFCIYQWRIFSLASSRQNVAPGVITAVEQGNRCYYRFRLGQEEFTGWEIPLYNRPVPARGDKVSIYYDPAHPSVNAMTDFKVKSLDALGPVPLTLLASGVAIFVVLRQWYLNSRFSATQA